MLCWNYAQIGSLIRNLAKTSWFGTQRVTEGDKTQTRNQEREEPKATPETGNGVRLVSQITNGHSWTQGWNGSESCGRRSGW